MMINRSILVAPARMGGKGTWNYELRESTRSREWYSPAPSPMTTAAEVLESWRRTPSTVDSLLAYATRELQDHQLNQIPEMILIS